MRAASCFRIMFKPAFAVDRIGYNPKLPSAAAKFSVRFEAAEKDMPNTIAGNKFVKISHSESSNFK